MRSIAFLFVLASCGHAPKQAEANSSAPTATVAATSTATATPTATATATGTTTTSATATAVLPPYSASGSEEWEDPFTGIVFQDKGPASSTAQGSLADESVCGPGLLPTTADLQKALSDVLPTFSPDNDCFFAVVAKTSSGGAQTYTAYAAHLPLTSCTFPSADYLCIKPKACNSDSDCPAGLTCVEHCQRILP